MKHPNIDSNYLKQKFSRHIGRVLTFMDAAGVEPELKQIVKGELWTLYSDLNKESK